MAKQKLHKLKFDEEFDFQLIGICCSHSDYTLCWGINNALNIALEKEDDYAVFEKKVGEHLHSFYSFYDEEEHLEYYLIKNISNDYQRLIPEKDQIDYFFVIKNNFIREINDMLISLKEIEIILAAFIFDPNTLKSKGNLVF